jgi:cation-transporting ATPase F
VELPIFPVQSLWVNMTTAGSLGLMLAFEPKEVGIMARRPRDPQGPLLSRRLWVRIMLVGVLLMAASFGLSQWEERSGAAADQARTVAVNIFAAISSLYLLNCRSLSQSIFATCPFGNPWIWVGLILMANLQAIFTYLPVMNDLFNATPLGLESWLRILGSAVIANLVVASEKWFRLRSKDDGQERMRLPGPAAQRD